MTPCVIANKNNASTFNMRVNTNTKGTGFGVPSGESSFLVIHATLSRFSQLRKRRTNSPDRTSTRVEENCQRRDYKRFFKATKLKNVNWIFFLSKYSRNWALRRLRISRRGKQHREDEQRIVEVELVVEWKKIARDSKLLFKATKNRKTLI